jgi:hypothetical protein
MIEQWVIDRPNPLRTEKLIILADPQRMIRAGARAVDGWAKESGFTVLFCSGNLALRELYENLRSDPTAKLILVDRTRDKAKLPLFYPAFRRPQSGFQTPTIWLIRTIDRCIRSRGREAA